MSSKKKIQSILKKDSDLSFLNFSMSDKKDMEASLIKIKSFLFSLQNTILIEKLLNELRELRSRLISFRNLKENTPKINYLMAFCYLQVCGLLRYEKINEDFTEYLLPILSSCEEHQELIELKAFFLKELIEDNYKLFYHLVEKTDLNKFLSLIFQSHNLLDVHPEFKNSIKEILQILIKEICHSFDEKTIIFEQLIINFDIQNKNDLYAISKEILKENSLFSDKDFQITLENLLCDQKSQKIFPIILRAIYSICKRDKEFLPIIIDKIENLWLTVSKEKRGCILNFFGRICAFKNSKFCFVYKRWFENFICSLNDKTPVQSSKKEFIAICLKFCKNFNFVNEKHEKNSLILSDEEFKLLKYFQMIEEKLLPYFFFSERDYETKVWILNEIFLSMKKSTYFVSSEFFVKFLEFTNDQNHLIKVKCYVLLINIFNCYYSALFKEKYNILEQKNRVILNKGEIECVVSIMQEKSKRFEWFFFEILFKLNTAEKNENILFMHAMNNVFFNEFLQPSEQINYMIGIFYLTIENFFENMKKHSDLKNKGYEEYVFKILGSEWKMDQETLNNKKSKFIIKALEKIMKLKVKLSKLIDLSFFQKNNEDKCVLKEKLIKCCGVLIGEKKETMDFFEEIEKFYDNNEEFRKNLENGLRNTKENILKIYSNNDFDKKYNNERLFLIEFFEMNKEFDSFAIEKILKKCCSFCNELKRYENREIFLFLISGLKLVLSLMNFAYIIVESHININNLMKIVMTLCEILEQNSKPSTSTSKNYELNLIKNSALTLNLKIISKFNNISQVSAIEEQQAFFLDLLKNWQLNDNQIKYLAFILIKFDEISSEKLFLNILDNSLKNLDMKNMNLSKNINIIYAFINSEQISINKISYFLQNKPNIFDQYLKIIEKPISLSKTLVISNLTVNKKKILKIIYKLLFQLDKEKEDQNVVNSLQHNFITILLEILINFNEISASALLADKNYLRINSLDLILKMISRNQISEDLVCELFIKLSILCFDENILFRKIFFKFFVKFALKQEIFIGKFVSLFFLFTLDEDSTLHFLSKNVLLDLISILGKKIKEFLEEDKINFSGKIIENSPEYLIVYLVFIIVNSPFFLNQNKTLDVYKVVKLMQNFFDIVFQNNTHRRSLNFLVIVLENLKKKKPKFLNISKNMDLKLYSIKKKKEKINENESTSPDSEEEKYHLLIQIFSDMIRKNFDNNKIIDSLKNEVVLVIDGVFYEEVENKVVENHAISLEKNPEEKATTVDKVFYKKFENNMTAIEKNMKENKTKNKITEKRKKKEPKITVPKVAKRKEETIIQKDSKNRNSLESKKIKRNK